MNKANYTKSIKWILFVLCCIVSLLLLARFFESQKAYAEVGDGEIDYSFEDVPIDKIDICTERNISEVKPSESFSVTYRLSPWYTTAESVYFNVSPSGAAKVLQISNVKIENGQAFGDVVIEVSPTADVGSVFTVTANANGIYSNEIEMTVAKIPVEQIKLSFADSDDKLHIGKSKQVSCEVLPKTASNKSVRYELSGSGMKYVKEFDSKTGVVTAVSDVSNVQADSIIVVTAFAEDDSAVSDSIVISFYVPSITVQLSASTPLGGKTADNEALAVANSRVGETVQMHATVNGVDTTGLNYVIVQGREYIENGLIRGDGSFTIKPTSTWTASMKKPHAEIRVRAAYSDGFDEIGISVYVPVEQLLFIDSDVRRNVENNRSYDLAVKALPEYATFLNDSLNPFVYTLNGLDSGIATVDDEGLVSLPKSLTSKGNVINYTASLNGAWDGVDVAPLDYVMSIVPVSANDITAIKVLSALEPIADDEGGEFYEMFLEWNAEKYSKRLSKRVKDGLDTSVANGTFCGGFLIYGYRKRLKPVQGKNDRFIKYIEIVPEEAEILQYAFDQFDRGVSKKEIAEALNAKGLRFKGKPFTNKTFDRYFTNRKYTGEFEFGERLCDNMYPKIIEKDLFERVQKRLEKSRYKGAIHKALEPYILTGKLICGHCKTPMVSDGGTNRDGSRRYYYACKKMKKHACNKKRVEKDTLEFDVTVFVKNVYSDPKNAEKAAEATVAYFEKRTDNDNLIAIKNKIANATKEVDKLTDSFVNATSVLLRNNIERKIAEYETLLNDLQAQEAQIELERGLQMTKQNILDFIAELMMGDPHDKKYQKRLIDNLVKRVVVRDDGFSVVTTLKGSPKFYADDPEVVESEIERLRELMELENEQKQSIMADFTPKAEQIRTPPPRQLS